MAGGLLYSSGFFSKMHSLANGYQILYCPVKLPAGLWTTDFLLIKTGGLVGFSIFFSRKTLGQMDL